MDYSKMNDEWRRCLAECFPEDEREDVKPETWEPTDEEPTDEEVEAIVDMLM